MICPTLKAKGWSSSTPPNVPQDNAHATKYFDEAHTILGSEACFFGEGSEWQYLLRVDGETRCHYRHFNTLEQAHDHYANHTPLPVTPVLRSVTIGGSHEFILDGLHPNIEALVYENQSTGEWFFKVVWNGARVGSTSYTTQDDAFQAALTVAAEHTPI